MQLYYFLPIVLIAAAVAYSLYARKTALAQAANMTPEEAARSPSRRQSRSTPAPRPRRLPPTRSTGRPAPSVG